MFKRRIPQNDWEQQQRLRQEEKRTEILARGPKQPCPSNWEWDPQSGWRVNCQTGISADLPHEHRALAGYGSHLHPRTRPYGQGDWNPWEKEWQDEKMKEWLTASQDG